MNERAYTEGIYYQGSPTVVDGPVQDELVKASDSVDVNISVQQVNQI
jgi:hypothetical protein